jgi:hypothetical protein
MMPLVVSVQKEDLFPVRKASTEPVAPGAFISASEVIRSKQTSKKGVILYYYALHSQNQYVIID